MQFAVLHTTGKSTTIDASDAIFGAKPNQALIAQAVRVFLSNQRQGTSKTKTRSEINRTKKKWFKQKGTGNARHGARTPNIFVGGGVSHGPTGHENWTLSMSKTMRRKVLMSALSLQKDRIVVTTVLSDIEPKTKDAAAFLKKLAPESKKTLIVVDKVMENIERSMGNLPQVVITHIDRLHIFDVVYADAIIMTKEAIKAIEDRLVGQVGEQSKVAEKTAPQPATKQVKKTEKKETIKPIVSKKQVKKTAAKTKKSTE